MYRSRDPFKFIRNGEYDSSECLRAFLQPAQIEQYHLESRIERKLLDALPMLDNLQHHLKLLDVLCGDGTHLPHVVKRYFHRMYNPIDYFGLEKDPAEVERANRKLNLLRVNPQRDPWSARRMVSERSGVTQFDPGEKKNFIEFTDGPADIARFSHNAYTFQRGVAGDHSLEEARQARLDRLLAHVMDSVKPEGFLLAFHENAHSDLFIPPEKDAAMHGNASERIAASAKRQGLYLLELPYESVLYFPRLSRVSLERIKDPKNLAVLTNDELRWLQLFSFRHKHRGGINAMHARGELGPAIEELAHLLADNEETRGGGPSLVIRSHMQGLTRDAAVAHKLEKAFSLVEEAMPELQKKAQEALLEHQRDHRER